MRAGYARTVSTSVLSTAACVLRTYHVRFMMADTDLNQELMCLTELNV